MSHGHSTQVHRSVRKPPGEREVEILRVARAHFAEHGFRGTDVQDIADALGIGKGTVYRLFPAKAHLFQAAVRNAVDELREHVEQAVAPLADPLDKICTAVRAYLAFFDAEPGVVELFIQERAEFGQAVKPVYFVCQQADQADWFVLFDELRAQGRMRDMDSRAAGEALGDMLYGAVVGHRLSGADDALTARAPDILRCFLDGVLVPADSATAIFSGG